MFLLSSGVWMPSEGIYRKLRVFVACPGDVEDEKERLGKIIDCKMASRIQPVAYTYQMPNLSQTFLTDTRGVNMVAKGACN